MQSQEQMVDQGSDLDISELITQFGIQLSALAPPLINIRNGLGGNS